PSHFVEMETLPLTSNGKIDRKALPRPDRKESEECYVAPRTETEEIIVSIWHHVLGMEHIGVHDSFFELGGHSLLATQAASNLKAAFGIELPLRDLFTYTTVQELAERIDQLCASRDEKAQDDSRECVSLQDYIQQEEMSHDQELLELLMQLEELSDEEKQSVFKNRLAGEGVKNEK
ncbi:phosphopantetheine-binding protein, partial [Thermoactinomyces sp. DSM 45892]|uniref:phosphopantetheine-binding protein n=1 Tax=Thermoactinomyces sp. DSM 45892 TaxID=1882753 RepID=UPI00089C299D